MNLIDNVIGPLDTFISTEADMLTFAEDSGFIPLKIDRGNFHTLSLFPSTQNLVAIDGGNTAIFDAPNFSLQFMKIVAVEYRGAKQEKVSKHEFFCLIKAVNVNNKKKYMVETFGDKIFTDVLVFDAEIVTLDDEKYRVETSSIGNIVRRFAELKLATAIAEKRQGICLVIDGSIKAKTQEENNLIAELLVCGRQNDCVIGFLSKTCRLLTQNASSLNSVLNELGPKSTWYYYPVFKIDNILFQGNIYFVKLNSKSKYVFKLELDKELTDSKKIEQYILSLVSHAADPVFIGYPYCLIHADKCARVTDKEKDYLKTIFLSKIKNKEKLRYLLSNLDAHNMLDTIEF